MFQNLPLPAGQEVRDSSSGVTTYFVMKNDEVMYHQVSSFSLESMRLRDELIPALGQSIRDINKDGRTEMAEGNL